MADYKEYIKSFYFKAGEFDSVLVKSHLEKYSELNSMFASGPTVPYIFNPSTLKYLLMCNSADTILGVPASEFMNNGIKTLFDKTHRDDMEIIYSRIIPDFIKLRRSRPKHQTKKLRFTLNFRFNHPNKKYIHCLEQVMILETDKNDDIILNFGIITDISEYKTDNSMIGTVSILNKANEYEIIYSKNYSSNHQILYTNREMDIIRLLAKGLPSKAIATRLNISSHTVDQHRRNMLKKANMNNTQELVHDALRQGWL